MSCEQTAQPQRKAHMSSVSPKRTSWSSLGIAIVALLVLLLVPVSAQANRNGTAQYTYKVTRFDYQASGRLTGAKFQPSCTPAEDALWEGSITTDDYSEVAGLGEFGKAFLAIHSHGTSGDVSAKTTVKSNFTAMHRETTACEHATESAYSLLNCNSGLESEMNVLVDVSGGVGNRVAITWNFFQDNAQGNLVANTFTCGGEPFEFSAAANVTCSRGTIANLGKFTAKIVRLPFQCLSSTMTPPPGRAYTNFGATVVAKGALFLKRTRKR